MHTHDSLGLPTGTGWAIERRSVDVREDACPAVVRVGEAVAGTIRATPIEPSVAIVGWAEVLLVGDDPPRGCGG